MKSITDFIGKLGPGLLYAGAAIGVSHLVQSTRAGAEYGLALIAFIIIANILKYPFFEFGPRYTMATGKNLLEGYRQLGKFSYYTFVFITIGTMFTIIATITLVCAGLLSNVFDNTIDVKWLAAAILIICFIILSGKNYQTLDKAIKFVILLLTITSVVTLIFGIINYSGGEKQWAGSFDWENPQDFAFLIALLGWMPAPLDISVWHSLWMIEKRKNGEVSYSDFKTDFKVGYWGTTFLAVIFVLLGMLSFYGTNIVIPESSVGFANMLVEIYTSLVGEWIFWIVLVAAFTTMFSTTLTISDAYPRTILALSKISFKTNEKSSSKIYFFTLFITLSIGWIILSFFTVQMKSLIQFATIISFVTAPILAYFNLKVIQSVEVPLKYRPNKFEKNLSYLGLLFLVVFSLLYIIKFWF